MTRRLLIAGNWKMNLSRNEASSLARDVASHRATSVDVAVMPPFPWLLPVKDVLSGTSVLLGAQNCHWAPSGAYTGEVSASMLADVCDYVLAGHSERRHVFGESDDTVARKMVAIGDAGLAQVLCVGETIDERRAGDAADVVARQLAAALEPISSEATEKLTIAYEPVWAIGTGVAATSADAQEMCAMIRTWLARRFDVRGHDIRVLYGGSMTPSNALELLTQPDVDGGLVGGASLTAQSFLSIVEAAESVSRM